MHTIVAFFLNEQSQFVGKLGIYDKFHAASLEMDFTFDKRAAYIKRFAAWRSGGFSFADFQFGAQNSQPAQMLI
ncbi:MAG: hypothetical protein JNN12_01560 [Bacteroidetes Order II. Incertae sedis bacterium]|nr:hypothetical protein [Bacteroidetes Order II. bacterium]